ncbi:MAG: thiol-disulfide oxidoreductase [Aequorivita sp.]|jgi:predicted DCC family thiol-disulfide oxidoreductase YuxK|nr:thiol-disulfide oxidoreductase [Aequorivita sp.]MBP41790.1 thiol-disulfide oxidoreductase [Aequorivita sp.]HBC04118.1 thiol-disulfide oxidoreductase [Aequorivita sp.]|tara:strand:- start:13711 stop:14196 length:486 start_codon:yes stop_codon:yes gene_type:complete
MFAKIQKTDFPPSEKPTMVWDGECGFCNYWITRWKSKTENRIHYKTFQEVSDKYPDIPLKEFKKASRLIEKDGQVYSGPNSAYRSFLYFKKPNVKWHRWYSENRWFNYLSDHIYNYIAKHRSFMFTLTKILFGKNPKNLKPYWFLILLSILILIYLLNKFL